MWKCFVLEFCELDKRDNKDESTWSGHVSVVQLQSLCRAKQGTKIN